MLRNLVVAGGVALGMLGLNLTAGEARADGFGLSISGRNFGIGISSFGPVYYPPVYAAPVYAGPVYAPPVYVQPIHHYHVYYRDCHRSPWRLYGTYHSHWQAHRVVDRLEDHGYDARVQHH